MRSDIINALASDVLELSVRFPAVTNNFRRVSTSLNKTDKATVAFILSYGELDLGWHAARFFAHTHTKLPLYLTADDHWIWRAYLVNCNPDLYADRHVSEALALSSAEMKHERETVQGLLLCEESPIDEIAQILGIHGDTIRCYEKLFYNVRDRFEDHMFLARTVYPHGRAEEFYDNYMQNTTYGDLIRRTGFNRGKEFVAYMAGIRSPLVQNMLSGDMASRLEKVIMANGFILANTGLINQRADAVGLHNAKNLIAAAKAGGTEQQESSGFDDIKVAAALRGELVESGRAGVSRNVAAIAKITSGEDLNIIDAEIISSG